MGDVVFCLRFVLCLSGVGDEGVGWGVVNVGHFIEVVDEGFERGVVVGERDGGFYGVGGIFSHAFYYTSIALFVNNVLWLYEINHMRFSTTNLHRKSLNRARPTRPTRNNDSSMGWKKLTSTGVIRTEWIPEKLSLTNLSTIRTPVFAL